MKTETKDVIAMINDLFEIDYLNAHSKEKRVAESETKLFAMGLLTKEGAFVLNLEDVCEEQGLDYKEVLASIEHWM